MANDNGRPGGLSSQATEPVPVSALRASIPDASAWRTDSPPYGERPIWQYVWLQGECYHSGATWFRQNWGTAAIRPNGHPDGMLGYRRSDIERICRDGDIALCTVDVVGWLPMAPPALLSAEVRSRLAPCDYGEWSAQAIEAELEQQP